MNKVLAFLSSPRNQIRWWAFWTVAWLFLDPVSVLTGLQHSVGWLNQQSDFANFASCGTALVAAWSYMRARNVDEKVDQAAHFERIEALEQTMEARLQAIEDKQDRQGKDNGAALAELLDLVHQAPIPEPRQPGPAVFPPRPPTTDQIAG